MDDDPSTRARDDRPRRPAGRAEVGPRTSGPRRAGPATRGAIAAAAVTFLACALTFGCGEDDGPADPTPAGDEERVHGLTPAQAAETLAKVGSTTITVGDFAAELASKGAFTRTRFNSPERRREFLDQMVRFELLAQEAERRGLDQLPEVQRTRKQMLIRAFLEERFGASGEGEVTDEDVREYYEAHPDEYHTPEQVRASHILIRSRSTAQRVLAQLREAPADLRLYRQLAEAHNQDEATRDRFGDLRFFGRPGDDEAATDVPREIAEAAFGIERIGGLHPELVRTRAGYHIVKLTGRRAAMHRSLADAARPIRNRLERERREAGIAALIEELQAEADVEENLDALSQIELNLPEEGSPAFQPTPGADGQAPSTEFVVPPRGVPERDAPANARPETP